MEPVPGLLVEEQQQETELFVRDALFPEAKETSAEPVN